MLFSRPYLHFLLGGTILCGWAGSRLQQPRPASFVRAGDEKTTNSSPTARQDAGSRGAEKDIPTLIRELIASFPRNPNSAVRFEAWDHVRNFSLKQVQEGLAVAGDPLERTDPENYVAWMLLSRWGELEPEAALASLVGRESENKEGLTLNLVGTWMQRDPDAALRWAREHPDEIDLRSACRMRAATLLEKPPAAALAETRSMPVEVRQHLVGMLAQTMVGSESERARCFQLLEGMDEEDRLRAAKTMVETTSIRSPREGLDLLEGLPMSDEVRQQVMARSIERYLRQNPAEALDWLAARPSAGSISDRGQALNEWAMKDAAAAEAWIDRQPQAAPILVAALEAANLKILSGNTSPTTRALQGERMRSSFLRWQKLEPESAARWLEKAPPDVAEVINPAPIDEK